MEANQHRLQPKPLRKKKQANNLGKETNEERLRALVYQAFELREGPYLREACEAVVDWWERFPLSRFERNEELVALIRSTYPQRRVA